VTRDSFVDKRRKTAVILIIVAVAFILALGGYFLYRGGYIFADVAVPSGNNYYLADLSEIVKTGAMRANSGRDSTSQITSRQYLQEILNGRDLSVPIEGQATYVSNVLIQDYFPDDWTSIRQRGADYDERGYEDRLMNQRHAQAVLLREAVTNALELTGDNSEAFLDLVLNESAGSAIADKAEEALTSGQAGSVTELAGINASAVANTVRRVVPPAILASLARLGSGPQSEEEIGVEEGEPQSGEESGSELSEGYRWSAEEGPCSDEIADPNCQGVIDTVRKSMEMENGALRMAMTKGSNFSINPNTGRLEYVSYVKNGRIGDVAIPEGQIWWDPFTQTYSGYVSADYAGYNARLFADARSGDVYMAVAKSERERALIELGGIKLMDVRVGDNGQIGGKFKYQNRVFYYNPESQGFEIPIAIGGRRMINLMSETVTDREGNISDPLGIIYLDSNGDVRGRVDLPDRIGGSLFIDRDGTIAYARTITDDGTVLGSVFVDSTGNFGGQVDIAQAIGIDLNVFVGFDRSGFTGVSVPIGLSSGAPISIGIGRDGGLTIGGVIPIGGLPLPINIGQDEHGNFRLGIPFLGSIRLFGHENRPLWPPELAQDEDGGMDTSCIYFRHSFKKLFKTVRIYQVPCTKIEKEEQMQRGALIFDVYNKLLERNPSLEEFVHWYFYGGHMLYEFPRHERDKAYRMEMTETRLNQWITCKGRYGLARNILINPPADNCNEYRWIQQGNEGVNAPTRPENIMQINPFDESTWEQIGNTEGDETESPLIQEFLDQLEQMRENDPGDALADYYEEIEDIDSETARANVDLGDAQVETVLLTRAGDYPIIEKFTDNTGIVVTLRKGFNEVFTPQEVGYLNLIGVEADGIRVFEYDPTYSTEVEKSWRVGLQTMKPGTGYYLYNSGEAGRKIILRKKPSLGAGESDTIIKKGWNLLANSRSNTIKLGNYSVKTALPGWSGGCDIVGLCVGNAKIGDLISSDPQKTRAYQKLYFLVPETDPSKLNKLVEVDVLEKDYLKQIELKPGQMFWIYLYE